MKKIFLPLIRLPLAAIGAFLMGAPASNASIVVTDSISTEAAGTANGADTTDTVLNWGLDGGNTVAVLFAGENTDGITATFGGQSMNVVFGFDGDRHYSGIAYLINPTVSAGDVVINANNNGSTRLSHAYSVVSLSGVGSVAGTDSRSSDGTLDYTTLDSGYVLGAAANANWNGPAPTYSGNVDTAFFSDPVDGNFSASLVHGNIATAGAYSDTYGSIVSAVTVAFNPVPEPSSFALLAGCFGLTWVMLRRRS